MAIRYMKRYSTSLIREMQIKTLSHTFWDSYYQKGKKSVNKDVEKKEPLYMVGGNEN